MEKFWHYAKGGEKHGPITATQLKVLATTGQISPDDLVWREDMKEWRKAGSVKGLFSAATAEAGRRDTKNQKARHVPTASTENPIDTSPHTGLPKVAKYTAIGCGGAIVLLLICSGVLTMIAKTIDPEGFANIRTGKNRDGSERVTSTDLQNTTPGSLSGRSELVGIGTLEEMGEEAFHDLPFADVDRSPDIDAVPLSEAFAQAGTFRFRSIRPDIFKATETRQEWEESKKRGYKERTGVLEFSETFDIRPNESETFGIQPSEGFPKVMIEWQGTTLSGWLRTYPIIRIGARPGDRWELTYYDVVGDKFIYRYQYRRCVRHNGTPCIMIESGLFTDDGKQLDKYLRWYAEGVGLVKQSEYVEFYSGLVLFQTNHRIVK